MRRSPPSARYSRSDEPTPDPEPPELLDVLTTVFGLGEREVDIYVALRDSPDATTGHLEEVVDLDRSNVNRGLLALRSQGLVQRKPQLLESGGQQYRYRAVPPSTVRERLREGVEAWADAACERLAAFPDDADDSRRVAAPASGDD